MKKLMSILLVLVLALGLAACATETAPAGSTTPSSTVSASSAATEPSESAEEAKIGEGLKVGFAQIHYTNAFRIAETESVKKAFEDAGFEFVWNEAKKDTATQIANVNDLLAQGIDYLILAPNEKEGLVAALDAAKAKDVPVILIDRICNGTPGEDFVAAIMSNFVAEGENCAKWIVENYPDGCNVVEITGTSGASSSLDRVKGFNDYIEKYPNIKVLATQTANYARADAQVCMENLLQAHGDQIDVVFTENDDMQFGILQAIQGVGKVPGKDICIVAAGDGGKEVLQAVADGKISACAECTPLLGPQALDVVIATIKGETVEPLQQSNDRFYTIDNAATLIAEGSTW